VSGLHGAGGSRVKHFGAGNVKGGIQIPSQGTKLVPVRSAFQLGFPYGSPQGGSDVVRRRLPPFATRNNLKKLGPLFHFSDFFCIFVISGKYWNFAKKENQK
jgi:hypothetical protein